MTAYQEVSKELSDVLLERLIAKGTTRFKAAISGVPCPETKTKGHFEWAMTLIAAKPFMHHLSVLVNHEEKTFD